jgi:hypothetical protein
MYKSNHCSPRKKNDISCYSYEILLKIAQILNENGSKIKLSKNKKTLHKRIEKEIKKISDCKNEICWKFIPQIKKNLDIDTKKETIESFKPEMPTEWEKNPNTWLNTSDIDNVMEQYEKKYPNFNFLGTHPIDFALKKQNQCLVSDDELCKINIKELNEKYDSLGLVLNTDNHNESGEHWFSIYIDLKGRNLKNIPTIYYFDSALSEPHEEIIKFVNTCKSQLPKLNFLYNDIQHQYGSTECGIYCLHFLTEMLKGKSFKNYINNKRNDKIMENFRKEFFIKK